MKSIVTLTEAARNHLETLFSTSDKNVLLVSINNKGCSGHSYDYTWTSEHDLAPFDEKIQLNTGILAISSKSVLRLLGSTLDIETTLFEQKFQWNNPQVTNSCGCGKSVSF